MVCVRYICVCERERCVFMVCGVCMYGVRGGGGVCMYGVCGVVCVVCAWCVVCVCSVCTGKQKDNIKYCPQMLSTLFFFFCFCFFRQLASNLPIQQAWLASEPYGWPVSPTAGQ